MLKIGRPNQCSIYRIHNPVGLKLLTRLRLGLSHLNEHRFNHNFQSCINPLCSCSLAIESTTHFLLHCHHFSNICSTLLNSINEVLGSITNISDLSDCALVKILLFGDQNYTQVENAYIYNQCYYEVFGRFREIQWSTFVVVHDLNDLNVFVITCFFTVVEP